MFVLRVVRNGSSHPVLLILLFIAHPALTMPILALDLTIALRLDPLILLVQDIWLHAQHPRHTHQRNQEQDGLDKALSGV